MRKIIILKCGCTYPVIEQKYGTFEQWIIEKTNMPSRMFFVYDVEAGETLRHPSDFVAGIITGSHAMVTDRKNWMKTLDHWIIEAKYSGLPVLGICFGHQAIANALGGTVRLRNTGPEQGKINVELTDEGKNDPLFKGIGDQFESFAMHEQSVMELPKNAMILARNNFDPHQAFKVGNLYGVQFHPEFSSEIMESYLKMNHGVKKNNELNDAYKNNSIISNFLDDCFHF